MSGTRTDSTQLPCGRLDPSRAFATTTGAIWTRWRVIDRERVLAKLDDLHGYLRELQSVIPSSFTEYLSVEKKRSCERLLQVSIEAVIDACALIVTGLRLGLPGDEDDLFEKLAEHGVISRPVALVLRRMKGMRNLLVHEYGRVDDAVVFEAVSRRLGDFDTFRREILTFLRRG